MRKGGDVKKRREVLEDVNGTREGGSEVGREKTNLQQQHPQPSHPSGYQQTGGPGTSSECDRSQSCVPALASSQSSCWRATLRSEPA